MHIDLNQFPILKYRNKLNSFGPLEKSLVSQSFYYVTAALYGGSTLGYLAYLVLLRRNVARIAFLMVCAGCLSQTACLVFRFFEAGFAPITSRFDASSYFSWLLVVLYIIIHLRYQMPVLGAFLTPLALVLTITASLGDATPLPLESLLKSPWLPVHVVFAFLGDALLGLAACFALMYIIQEKQLKSRRPGAFHYRLPSLEVLDRYSYRCITAGFPLLTMGIITGALWLKTIEGSYIRWQDGRQTATLLTWFLYAALLHGRLVTGWRGRRVAVLNVLGFAIIVITFVTLSHFLKG